LRYRNVARLAGIPPFSEFLPVRLPRHRAIVRHKKPDVPGKAEKRG
jgi:hypothetical protein